MLFIFNDQQYDFTQNLKTAPNSIGHLVIVLLCSHLLRMMLDSTRPHFALETGKTIRWKIYEVLTLILKQVTCSPAVQLEAIWKQKHCLVYYIYQRYGLALFLRRFNDMMLCVLSRWDEIVFCIHFHAQLVLTECTRCIKKMSKII